MTEVAAAMGLGTVQKASLFAMRQAGAGAANLGGGPIVDMMKSHWGLILTGCMIVAAGAFALVGASPNYPILLMAVLLISVPGALWHLPAAAALSQRFPERRGFAISMHGFGSYIGNVVGPLLVGGPTRGDPLATHILHLLRAVAGFGHVCLVVSAGPGR